jgi:hypothetical protein
MLFDANDDRLPDVVLIKTRFTSTHPVREERLAVYTMTADVGATARAPFTDPTLASGTTPVKVVHIVELRARINLLRAAYGLMPFAFTDPTLVSRQTLVKAVHVLELRAALREVYEAAGRIPPGFSDAITPGLVNIRANHIQELRDAVMAME